MVKENPRIRIALIITKRNRILLVQHKKGERTYWLLPGGGLKFGETIKECAKRELLEETNLRIKIGEFAFLSESIPPDRHRHVLNLFFFGEIVGGELKKGDDEVVSDLGFFSEDRLDELIIYPPIKENLKKILRKEKLNQKNLGNIWIG